VARPYFSPTLSRRLRRPMKELAEAIILADDVNRLDGAAD
jgi:hypothetical protein